LETSNLVDGLFVASANKPSLKGALSGHVSHLNFVKHQPCLGNGWS